MPPQPGVHIGVAAWIYSQNARGVLLLKRAGKDIDGYGTYCLPGGWLDFGETVFQAVEREVKEETGIFVKARRINDVVTCATDDGRWVATVVIDCDWINGMPTVTEPEKCAEVGFVELDRIESGELPLFAPLAEYIRRM
jgi:8-oxo-dGTP diphosphatase